jgi:hypothetical protein
MRRKGYSRRLSSVFILFVFAVFAFCVAFAEIRMPQTGKTVKTNGDLSVDCSHMDEGYVMVKGKKTNKRLKLRVKTVDSTLNYDLNIDGEYEVFPLQFGSGKYQISLYRNASGKKYSEEGKVGLNVKMGDPLSCFLYPNQYVNYNEETECVIKATELCAGMTDQAEIYKTICDFMKSGYFVYDFVKSVSVKAGVLPDIDGCWSKHMGICQDLSAVTIAMLRSQGVPARLMIGTLGSSTYHAWVTAVVNGEEKFFDPTAELNASSKTDTYTTERYY